MTKENYHESKQPMDFYVLSPSKARVPHLANFPSDLFIESIIFQNDRNLVVQVGNLSPVVLCLAFIFNLLAYSRGATSDPTTRAVTSIPPTLTVSGSANKERDCQRKTPVIQRSRTGGLENLESPRTPSPTKSKLNFLEGFRNTLRARSPVRSSSVPVRVKSNLARIPQALGFTICD